MSEIVPGNASTVRSCEDYELLISSAIDGECGAADTEDLRAHLRECGRCRETLAAYREISGLVALRRVMDSCPPVPVPDETKEEPAPSRAVNFFTGGSMFKAAAAAACFAFFLLGQYSGERRAGERVAPVVRISPALTVTPTMWAAGREGRDAEIASEQAELPFTGSIAAYRSAIADELRRGDVDWVKVRSLIEAIGELRTDLELLTVHMAFLEMNTGSSPGEVADHWVSLGLAPEGL